MGEAVPKKKKNENEKNGDGGGGAKKKEENPLTVVLKVDMHCEGCANKIIKCVKGFEGVQSVKPEIECNKLTVMGKKIDASKLREKLSNKTKKKVDLISPQPKKEKDSKPKENNDEDQTSTNNNKSDKKTDENKKKPKEPPVTTAVLKVALHCQGCIEKIHRVTSKFKGVQEMSVDRQKDLVTVKGTMDVKALSVSLTERLKRTVEIVPMKKEKDKDDNNNNKNDSGDKKDIPAGDVEKNNTEGGGNGNGNGGGKKKKKGGNGNGNGNGNGGGDGEECGAGAKMEGNKMEYMGMGGIGYGYPYGLSNGYGYGVGYGYGYGPGGLVGENLHAPQLFSDENPNACSIM